MRRLNNCRLELIMMIRHNKKLELKWVKSGVESGAKIAKSWTKSWNYNFDSEFQFNIDFLRNIIRFIGIMFKCFLS